MLGIKSTALRFGKDTKLWLSCFSTAMLTGLTTTGIVCDQTYPYYTTLGIIGIHLAHQIYSLNIDNPKDCANKFISNHQVGLILFVGIVLSSLLKLNDSNTTVNKSINSTNILQISGDNKIIQQ